MASEFDIASVAWQQHGVLMSANGAVVVPIVIDEESRALDAASTAGRANYILHAGTPIAKVSGGTTYKPVRRDTIASAAYSSVTTLTTVTVDNSTNCYEIGDVCKACTAVDDAGTSLGAITTIPSATTVTFAGDQTGNLDAADRMSVTETDIRDANGEPGALILISPCDVFNAAVAAGVDTPHMALVTGVIEGGKLLGPLSYSDAQLVADITGYIIPWVA